MEDDADLVRRSQLGDRQAFARLVERHQAVVLRVAASMVGSGGAADDVAQDAFVKAFTRLHQFHEGRSFRAWLLAIVANEARNRYRSESIRAAVTLRVAQNPASNGGRDATTLDPADHAIVHDRRGRLAQAVASLSDRDREVVALRFFAELSERETAEVLGCAIGTVKSRLSRALGRLRTELPQEALR